MVVVDTTVGTMGSKGNMTMEHQKAHKVGGEVCWSQVFFFVVKGYLVISGHLGYGLF